MANENLNPAAKPMAAADVPQQEQEPQQDKKYREARSKTLLRVVISIAIIAVGIFLILFIVSRAALYDSIPSMLNHMAGELGLMWQRITS